MIVPPTQNGSSRIISSAIGVFLVLVGLSFFILFGVMKGDGYLKGDLKISALLLSIGAALIWMGVSFLRITPDNLPRAEGDRLHSILLKLNPLVEFLGIVGFVLTTAHVVAAVKGTSWPTEHLLAAIVTGPVYIGLFSQKVFVHSRLFPDKVVLAWSTPMLRSVNILLRMGWFGYFAIPVAWFCVKGYVADPWRMPLEVVACLIVSVVYASQIFVLHYGTTREVFDSPAT